MRGDFCDVWHRRARRLLHVVDFQRRWFFELAHFYRHLSPQEFWLRYHEERARAKALWASGEPAWNLCDYYVLRQQYYHRDACFHAVAARIPPRGTLLEFGCGVAPVSAWLARHRADVRLRLYDIPSRTLEFARWRLPQAVVVGTLLPNWYDAIVCWEVLEHVPYPVDTMRALVNALAPGGVLFVDFVAGGGDGGGPGREAAIHVLNDALVCLRPLTPEGRKGLYVRR